MPLPRPLRAVVTGAGSGLGRAFCARLVARGARVLAADIDLVAARKTAADLGGHDKAVGEAIHATRADVGRLEDVERLASEVVERFGGVELIVNNAGVAVSGPVGVVPMADWRWIVDVNLWGVVHGCHVFVPLLRRGGAGHVINVASAAGLLCPPTLAPYNVTKAAVVALSETLGAELRGSGVGCTVLCPTFFPTNIGKNARATDPRAGVLVEKLMARSRLSADDVAEFALEAAGKGELYALPHADGRWAWRLKRAVPSSFSGLSTRLMTMVNRRTRR